ncbi:hypothetical protein M405DRAFT_866988 [Rhizopogon salebrosus TDB-379]|nr:hypothetical protein M405DRAFT_866988 [Rhizopogon salebrosus TDB-379]
MPMRTYPAFCTLNQSEPEPSPELEHTTASLPLDQAPHDELLVTRLLDQFRALIEQYKKLEFAPAIHVPPDFQQAITVEYSPPPTREFMGPVRSRQSPPRTPHACDNCRTSKMLWREASVFELPKKGKDLLVDSYKIQEESSIPQAP